MISNFIRSAVWEDMMNKTETGKHVEIMLTFRVYSLVGKLGKLTWHHVNRHIIK